MSSLRNFVNILRLQKLWRAAHPGQLPCDGNPAAGDEPERSCAGPLLDIIRTEKAQPLLGSDNVVRVTPERGDWRSQAPANSASFGDDEIAGRQMDESPSALQRSEAAQPEEAADPMPHDMRPSDLSTGTVGPGESREDSERSDDCAKADRQALFMAVQQARAILAKRDVNRSMRGDDAPSTKSIVDYRKKVALLIKAMKAIPVGVSNTADDQHRAWSLSCVLGKYADKSSSYFAMRAAMQWKQYRLLKALLTRQDRWQKQQRKIERAMAAQSADSNSSPQEPDSIALPDKMPFDESEVRKWKNLLQQAISRIRSLEKLSRSDCLATRLGAAKHDPIVGTEGTEPIPEEEQHKANSHLSTKALVRRLNKHCPQWQAEFRVANEVKAKYRSQALIQCLTGIRPTEFDPDKTLPKVKTQGAMTNASPGVVVTLTPNNTLLVRVPGGKVRQKAGQVERSFELQINAEIPAWFLDELRHAGGSKRFFADPDALTKHYGRVSQRMFASFPSRLKLHITPYAFRHAMATNLRESGWSVEEIAGFLGERSADTVKHYGLRRSGSKKPKHGHSHSVLRGSVQHSHDVKPANKAKLNAVIRSRSAKKSGPSSP